MDANLFVAKKQNSAVDYVINSIKSLLLQKKLLPGDLLPSETELAESLNVGRGSVREAMKILQAYGVVEVKRGDGTYICANVADKLIEPFLFNLILSQPDIRELVELRLMIETQIIKQVIQHNNPGDIDAIILAHQDMQRAIENGIDASTILEKDIQFHDTLAKACNNVLMYKIYHFVLDLFSPYIEKTYTTSDNSTQAFAYHDAIVTAITERNIDHAITALQVSIDGWRRLLSEDH